MTVQIVRRAELYNPRTGERWAIERDTGGRWWICVEAVANRAPRHVILTPGADVDQAIRSLRILVRRAAIQRVS